MKEVNYKMLGWGEGYGYDLYYKDERINIFKINKLIIKYPNNATETYNKNEFEINDVKYGVGDLIYHIPEIMITHKAYGMRFNIRSLILEFGCKTFIEEEE